MSEGFSAESNRIVLPAGLAEAAAAADAPMVVDNTTATSLLQRPLDWGAAAALYSLTKAISGHSDVIAGERRARWPGETAPDGLIRLSVGVEPAADLIADVDEALRAPEVL